MYDLIIIGFGKAGKTLATQAAQEDLRVTIIEENPQRYGGTCINVACLPTKHLVEKAKLRSKMLAQGMERDREYDLAYYQRAIASKNEMTARLRQKNYDKLASLPTVSVIDGRASLVAADTVRVERPDGASGDLQARAIVINTGSEPKLPDIPDVEEHPRVVTSESLMELDRLPERLAIVGGGFVGLEFASMYAGFGSEVTVLHSGSGILSSEDKDMAEAVQARLEELGVRFVFEARVTSVDPDGTVHYAQAGANEVLAADTVLMATGRKLRSEGLNLEAVGVATSDDGAIQVNDQLETTVEGIYAVGDVKDGAQFTYVSLDDSRIVWPALQKRLLGQAGGSTHLSASTRRIYPQTTFVDPPYSRVGLSETEARETHGEIIVKASAAAQIPKTQVVEETAGRVKVILDATGEQILGAQLFCYESHEVINLLALAIHEQIPAASLRDQIYNHPVMSEMFNELLS